MELCLAQDQNYKEEQIPISILENIHPQNIFEVFFDEIFLQKQFCVTKNAAGNSSVPTSNRKFAIMQSV